MGGAAGLTSPVSPSPTLPKILPSLPKTRRLGEKNHRIPRSMDPSQDILSSQDLADLPKGRPCRIAQEKINLAQDKISPIYPP
eukprot:10000703-Prorocentrum_lima.AAC.1